jgi:hypothetical protein
MGSVETGATAPGLCWRRKSRVEGTCKKRIEQDRQSRLWQRADENRRLAEARNKRETARDELVTEIVDLGTKAGRLRTWIELAAASGDPDSKRMVDWARQRLTAIERALNPERFGDWLRERKLFTEVDPFSYPAIGLRH